MRIGYEHGKPVFWTCCQLCGREGRCGPSVYEVHVIARYSLEVCRGCYMSNADGWGPALEPAFVAHLESKGIPLPERNASGWYPRE
jgi:hypothetical protein